MNNTLAVNISADDNFQSFVNFDCHYLVMMPVQHKFGQLEVIVYQFPHRHPAVPAAHGQDRLIAVNLADVQASDQLLVKIDSAVHILHSVEDLEAVVSKPGDDEQVVVHDHLILKIILNDEFFDIKGFLLLHDLAV
jgi:hypothetical protein